MSHGTAEGGSTSGTAATATGPTAAPDTLGHRLARRLLDHIADGTTDMADDVMEVPAEAYTSRERHEAERDALFLGHPLVLCLSGALPSPGSFLTVDLCDTPVLVTRDGAGAAHAFANVCRHRGVRVADGCGEAKRLTCPFHAWGYDLEGALVGMPAPSGFAGVDRSARGLVELPVAEGHGLVVGRLRPGDAIDLGDYLGADLADELDGLAFADWRLYSEPRVHRVGANWKVTLDTFRENYHFNYLHRTTLADYAYGGVLTFDPFGPHLRNCSAVKSIDALAGVPDHEWADPAQHLSYQYQLFPNTSLTFDARHIELWQIVPVDEASSAVVHSSYLRPGLSEQERARAVEMAPWICETVVDGEDFWVAGRTEPGLRTGLVGTVVFGRNEPALQHLHRGFADALGSA